MREDPIQTLLPVEGANPTREREHGADSPGSDEDQGPTPVVWLPPDEE